jgi:hypothetical protein
MVRRNEADGDPDEEPEPQCQPDEAAPRPGADRSGERGDEGTHTRPAEGERVVVSVASGRGIGEASLRSSFA